MRRALAVLSISVVVAVGLLIWAFQPVADVTNRPCGGGIFSATSPDFQDDSFKDMCDGARDERTRAIEAIAWPTGAALLGSLGVVALLGAERRQTFT